MLQAVGCCFMKNRDSSSGVLTTAFFENTWERQQLKIKEHLGQGIQIFKRLSSTNFTWYILEYLDPFNSEIAVTRYFTFNV